ncbi:hypothetical protein FQN54_002458 [Arachnomyces sp. PD_36]|nr:hypothetical protein FQN54_002458 [Arachnomyces sp. PD_36]
MSASIPDPSTVASGVASKNNHLELDPGGVYIAVFRMVSVKNYHWALIIATHERTGMMYHNTDRGQGFYFEARLHTHLLNSDNLLSLVKVSEITSYDREFHKHLAQRLKSIPTSQHRCRTWLKEALILASQEGLIGINMMSNTFQILEDEAIVAVQARTALQQQAREANMVTSAVYDV